MGPRQRQTRQAGRTHLGAPFGLPPPLLGRIGPAQSKNTIRIYLVDKKTLGTCVTVSEATWRHRRHAMIVWYPLRTCCRRWHGPALPRRPLEELADGSLNGADDGEQRMAACMSTTWSPRTQPCQAKRPSTSANDRLVGAGLGWGGVNSSRGENRVQWTENGAKKRA